MILIPAEWLSVLLAPDNLAEIGVVILGMIAMSVSMQFHALFEKTQHVLRTYAKYTDPNSEAGSKLSSLERDRLLHLCLNKLRIVISQFGGKLIVQIGSFISKK